jgi:hypothetical protein
MVREGGDGIAFIFVSQSQQRTKKRERQLIIKLPLQTGDDGVVFVIRGKHHRRALVGLWLFLLV